MLCADAICINQSDIMEREIQVRNMKDVYQEASELIADVGDWTEEPGLAFHCEASDARDKIYAFLGLSEDANELSKHISYSEPAFQLLRGLLACCI